MKKTILGLMVLMSLSACSELELGSHVAKQMTFPSDAEERVGDFKVGNPYKVKGRTYTPAEKYHYSQTGVASWYGPGFHGKMTANGEIFNKYELTAAHKTLQMPSIARVTNLENGKSIIVRINDRGPFANDRIIDLSEKAAELLDMKIKGTARVRVDVLEKESRMVASAAKQGVSTRGTELALNRGHQLHGMELQVATPITKPISVAGAATPSPVVVASNASEPTSTVARPRTRMFDQILTDQLSGSALTKAKPAYQQKVASYENTPVVTSKPLVPTAKGPIYIQAGAFQNEDNAMTMKMALYNVDEPINIHRSDEGGTPIYKVKIGPVSTVEKADEILTLLNKQGRQAHMIVAQN